MILADSFLCKCFMRALITEVGGGGTKASDSGAWREEVLASRRCWPAGARGQLAGLLKQFLFPA